MHVAAWEIDTTDVEDFIAEQETVVQHKIRADLKKLRTRGVKARAPLVKHLEGDVYYLRSRCNPHGTFRIFYFRDGARSFRAFLAFQKKGRRIPKRIRKRALHRFKQIKEAEE